MIREILSAEAFLWSCLWQSTIFVAAGLLGSFLLRHRSARAHQVLLLSIIAAVIVPTMSIFVKHYDLGVFVAEPVVIQSQGEDWPAASHHEATGSISTEEIGHEPGPVEMDSPPVMVSSGSAEFPWLSVMLAGWITASLILTARLAVTFVLGVRLLSRSIPLECERIKEAVHLAKAKLGIDTDVEIYSSRGVRSPVIWCWRRRPVLLVPRAAGRSDKGIDWASVLCHELAHWKRRDHISGLLAELVVCILPWQLLSWLAKSRLISLSEQACDDWVVASGQPGEDYAESLLDLTPGGQMAFVPAVVRNRKGLAGRVRRILKDNCGNPRTGVVWALAVSIVAVCIAVGISFAQTRPAKIKEPEEDSHLDERIEPSREIAEKFDTVRVESPAGVYESVGASSPSDEATADQIKVAGMVRNPQDQMLYNAIMTELQTDKEYTTDAEGKFVSAYAPSKNKRYSFVANKERELVGVGQLPGSATALELLDKYTKALDSLRSIIVKAEITSKHAGAFARDFRDPGVRGRADRGTSYRRTELRTDGKRSHWREYSWGHINEFCPSVHEEQAHYNCINWDGEMLYSYGVTVNNPESHGTAHFYRHPKNNEEKGELSRKFPASYLMGYNLESDERMDSILRRSRSISVRQKTERIGGSDCYVIDAKTNSGTFSLWIDPAHGYHLAKAEARLAPGDLGPDRNRLPKGDRRTTRLENVRFRKVDDIWVPTEADAYMDRHFGGRNYTTQTWHYKRTEVVVNPDHEALGSFDNPLENPKNDPELKNGEDVHIHHIHHIPGDPPQYIWQDGRVIDKTGKVIMDSQPKQKSDSKESQSETLGKKPGGLVEVTGLVKDQQGQAASDVGVTLFQTKQEYITKAGGKFAGVLAPSDNMRYFFAVHKQRELVGVGRLPAGQQHVEINLVPAKIVSGQVVDPNGKPVRGAQVAPLPMTCFHVLTDKEGEFDVGWDPNWAGDLKEFCLLARHQELNLAAVVEITESTEVVNITLEPGLILTGTVEDPNGMPIPGAKVGLTLHTQASASGWGCGTPVGPTSADDKGRYELKVLPQKQDWIIRARAEDYWQNRIETGIINRITEREEVGPIVLKQPILSVSGIIVDGSGKAVANIPVYMWGEGQPDLDSQTDGRGQFRFDKVCRGSINISAKNETLFGKIETQGGAKNARIVVSPRFEPKPVQKPNPAQGRLVHFPKDRSLGKLYIRDAEAVRELTYWFHWTGTGQRSEYLCEAQGDVNVPAGKRLTLTVNRTGWRDLSWLSQLRPDDLYELGITVLLNDPAKPSDKCMPHIAHLTGLKSLRLDRTNVTDRGFGYIRNLKALEYLHMPMRVTDRGMAYVAQLPSLKGLYFGQMGTQVTDTGLRYLAKLNSLEELALWGERMGDYGLAHLRGLPQLQYLFLYGTHFTDKGCVHLKDIPSLKILSFYEGRCRITNAGLADVSKIATLESLSLNVTGPITDNGIAHLSKMRSLKKLDIASSQITDTGLGYLSRIKTLERLDLPQEQKGITDKGLAHLGQLPNLKYLHISRMHYNDPSMNKEYYTDKGLAELVKCRLLENLSIGSIGITDAGLSDIAKLTNLTDLNLFGCDNVTDTGVAKLAALKSLRNLYIRHSDVSIAALNHLKPMPNLTKLNVYPIKRDGAILDISALTALEDLNLSFGSYSEKFVDADLKCLAGLKNLRSLQIGPRDYTDQGMAYLAGLTNMERLGMGGSGLTNEGLKYLADMKKLNFLSILSGFDKNKRDFGSGGNITDKGLRYLEGLQALSLLEIYSDNTFSDAALRRLQRELPNLFTLRINGGTLLRVNGNDSPGRSNPTEQKAPTTRQSRRSAPVRRSRDRSGRRS